jgi:tetratricopeptide (TPR) repeat protein
VLSALRGQGDRSDAALLGLVSARAAQAGVLGARGNLEQAIRVDEEALDLLKPLSDSPEAPRDVRVAEGSMLTHLGWARVRTGAEGAVPVLRRAQDVYRAMGAVQLTDLAASSAYAQAGIWLGEALTSQGRELEAKETLEETLMLASRVVAARPGHMPAMGARAHAGGFLGSIESNNLRVAPGLAMYTAAERAWEDFVKLDSSNSDSWNNLGVARNNVADALFSMGLVEESIYKRKQVVTAADKTRMSGFLARNLANWNGLLAEAQANFPELGAAGPAMAAAREFAAQAARGGFLGRVEGEFVSIMGASVRFGSGEYREALEQAKASAARLEAIAPQGNLQQDLARRTQIAALQQVTRAAYSLGDYAASEAAARQALDLRLKTSRQSLLDDVNASEIRTALAQAMARQGRTKEAGEIVRPVLRFNREVQARRSDDLVQQVHLARALLVSALASPSERQAHLAEAAAIMDRLPPAMKRWKPHTLLRDEIAGEQKKRL